MEVATVNNPHHLLHAPTSAGVVFAESSGTINISEPNSPDDPNIDPNDNTSGKSLRMEAKICGVCGDKALGNNFNAITCESCKAFFRRNALKQKGFVCPFNDNCKVDPVTRRFCQKCRLKKCFEIGMKKEWIMTDEEKKLKKRKIEQNKVKRQSSDVGTLDAPPAKSICLASLEGEDAEQEPLTLQIVATRRPIENHGVQGLQPTVLTSPHNIGSGADSTTDHVNETHTLIVQTSDIACSPSSSNSNSSSDLGYRTMSPLVMSQLLGSAPGSCTSAPTIQNHNGQGGPDLMSSNPQGQGNLPCGMNPRLLPAEFQGFQWAEEGNPQSQRSYAVPSAFKPPHVMDRGILRPADLSANQIIMGGDPTKGTGMHDEYELQQQPNRLRSKSLPRLSSAINQTYQTPLLSSLIRPGEPESPPDGTTSTVGMGNQFQRSNTYGGGVTYAQLQQHGLTHHHQMQPNPGNNGIGSMRLQAGHGYSMTSHAAASPFREECANGDSEEVPPPLPLNTMDSILSVAIRAEFNSFGMMCKPQESFTKDLNGAELAKLQELLMACEALGDPVDQEGPLKLSLTTNSDPTLLNVINLTDIAIRRLIKMSKKISGFKNMCQEDQIALLKGGCTEMMILRSVVTYDPDRDSWNIPHSYGYNIKLGVLKEARGNLYEEHQRFVKSFKPEWRADEKIMILLCAITLFTAERPNVIHKDVVKLEQDSYYYLLKRYLESMLNGCDARSTYLLLIRKIAELRILNSTHLRVFLEVNPREVEPLLREVFSMV